MTTPPTPFDFWYAVNNTEIVATPKRHLETFGNTDLNYVHVSELMDSVGQVRIRQGRMQAARPQIITPQAYANTLLEGFGEEAEKYLEWLRDNEDDVKVILRYGYALRQESFSEHVVTDALDAVLERVKADSEQKQDPYMAIVKGVDTPWDVCLIKLFHQIIQESAQSNIREMAQQRMFEVEDGIPFPVRQEIDQAFQAAAKDRSLIQSLGKKLQQHGLFEHYQDRFFSLVRSSGPS